MFFWHLADIGLSLFHGGLIVFNVVGWAFAKTRRAHFIALMFLLMSWIGLGYWRGWGYCLITDIHWSIKERLGEPVPSTFIDYVFSSITGFHLGDSVVNILSYAILVFSLTMSIAFNLRDILRKRSSRNFSMIPNNIELIDDPKQNIHDPL